MFSRLWQPHEDNGFVARVVQVRLAALMLHDTTLPIPEIMGRVGFEDGPLFEQMFRKCLGCSPVEYRQHHSWQPQPVRVKALRQ